MIAPRKGLAMTPDPARTSRADRGLTRRSNWWAYLETNSHLPEFQEYIRREIQSGRIRVVPGAEGRVRIIAEGEIPALDLPDAEMGAAPLSMKRTRSVFSRRPLASVE
jgi:hypothetical protein